VSFSLFSEKRPKKRENSRHCVTKELFTLVIASLCDRNFCVRRPDGNFSLCEEKFPYLQKKPILPAFLCVKKGTKKPVCVG